MTYWLEASVLELEIWVETDTQWKIFFHSFLQVWRDFSTHFWTFIGIYISY